MIWAVCLFILCIIVIGALRRKLLFEIEGSSLLISGTTKPGIFIYSIIMFPGTLLHELSHWLIAEILQVRTGAITLVPESDESGKETRLGSVATGRSDPIRGFLIGIAPFITGIFTLFLLGYFLNLGWGEYSWWIIALLIYGEIVVGNSMMTSRADMRYAPFMIILAVLLVIAYHYSGISLSVSVVTFLTAVFVKINYVLGLTIGLSLAMILVLYLVRRGLEHATRKRVTR